MQHKTGIHTFIFLSKHIVVLSGQDTRKRVLAENHVGIKEEATAIQEKDFADNALLGVHFLFEDIRSEKGGRLLFSTCQRRDAEECHRKTFLL